MHWGSLMRSRWWRTPVVTCSWPITTSRSQQADHRQAGAEGPQTSHHLVGAGQSRPDLGDGQDTEHHLGGAGQDMQQHRAVMQQRPIQQHTTVLVVVLQGDIVNAHGLV